MITMAIKIISNLTPTHAIFTFCYVLSVCILFNFNSFHSHIHSIIFCLLPYLGLNTQEKNYTRKIRIHTHRSFALCAIIIMYTIVCIDSPIHRFTDSAIHRLTVVCIILLVFGAVYIVYTTIHHGHTTSTIHNNRTPRIEWNK